MPDNIPPPPPGFVIDPQPAAGAALPPPPPGFTPDSLRRGPAISDEAWYQQTYGRPAPLNSPNDDYMTMTQLSQLRQQMDPEGATAWQQELQRMVGTGQTLSPLSEGVTPGPEYVPDTTGQRLRMGAQGLTFGLSDEIAGVVGGIGTALQGQGFQPGYDRNVEAERTNMEGFRRDHPAEAAISEMAGAAPLALIPGMGAIRAATLPGRIAGAAAGGAAAGGLYGLGTGEGSIADRLPGAVQGAAWGAGVGAAVPAVAPLVARGAAPLIRQFQGASRPAERPAETILRRNTQGMEPADVQAAQRLITEAEAQGVPLTWPEALSQATNGRVDITGLQRVVEQSRGGNPIMAAAMADRAGNVQAAMGSQAPRIGPAIDPVTLGMTVQRLSAEEIDGMRASINAATRDLYDAAEGVEIDEETFKDLMTSRVFQTALRAVRSDPIYRDALRSFPNQSVAVLDAIKKWLDDQAGAASTAGRNFRASGFGGRAAEVRDVAREASPEYGTALDTQSMLRRTDLEPLEAGPIGTMAGTDDLRAQIDALFASAPFEGMDEVVSDAVRRLASADPAAAGALVRQHITQVFNESTEALRTGPNQFGGANFAAVLIGNPQQARTLEAAVRALPDGNARWEGFSRLMEVLQATGRRQVAGSQTAFNQVIQEELRRGRGLGNLATLAASPTEALSSIRAWYNDLRLGRNTEALARIITDPNTGALLARIAAGGAPADVQRAVLALMQAANVTATPRLAIEQPSPFARPTLGQLIPAMP